MAELKVKPKVDVAFKKIFADNEELLKGLVCAALNLENAKKITLKPTELTPANPDEKFCRLDIRVEVDGREIDVEIQLNDRSDFRERTMYYWSAMFYHLAKGRDYSKIPQTVVIAFVDFPVTGSLDYHSVYVPMEATRHEILSDKMEIHFFELPKVPPIAHAKNALERCLNLICAKTESDIAEIEKVSDDWVNAAVTEVKRLNADDRFVYEVAAREVQLREERSALAAERDRGKLENKIETIQALLSSGMDIQEILRRLKISDKEFAVLKPFLDI